MKKERKDKRKELWNEDGRERVSIERQGKKKNVGSVEQRGIFVLNVQLMLSKREIRFSRAYRGEFD